MPVRLERYLPSAPLDYVVEHFWSARWDLPKDQPFTNESLPYPSQHLVLRDGAWTVTGVPTSKFRRRLVGRGAVFGVKFRPGGFRPFVQRSVAELTNRTVEATSVLAWVTELPHTTDWPDAELIQATQHVLELHASERDDRVQLVSDLVEQIAADRTIVRVEQVLAHFDGNARTLQRLFREYVGVKPKWVIQRYRLFEAADRLAAGEIDGSRVAQELGYFDQAHFIRDFKAIVGLSPRAFAFATSATSAPTSASPLMSAPGTR